MAEPSRTHMQGFKKADPDRWEFANANFQRDRPDLMQHIQRRKGQAKDHQPSNALIASGQSAIEVRSADMHSHAGWSAYLCEA